MDKVKNKIKHKSANFSDKKKLNLSNLKLEDEHLVHFLEFKRKNHKMNKMLLIGKGNDDDNINMNVIPELRSSKNVFKFNKNPLYLSKFLPI